MKPAGFRQVSVITMDDVRYKTLKCAGRFWSGLRLTHSTLQNDRSNLLHKRPGCHTSSCGGCRATVTCPLAADDLSE